MQDSHLSPVAALQSRAYTGARNFGPEPSEPRVHSTYSTLIGINDTWTTVSVRWECRRLSRFREFLVFEVVIVNEASIVPSRAIPPQVLLSSSAEGDTKWETCLKWSGS